VRLSPTEAVWPVSETGLTSLGCQQSCRVCFRCVCAVAVGWVLLLGSVALQRLRGLGKRSLRRCTSEIGFMARPNSWIEFLSARIHSPSLVRRFGPSMATTFFSFTVGLIYH
jgi:hypothetical protein